MAAWWSCGLSSSGSETMSKKLSQLSPKVTPSKGTTTSFQQREATSSHLSTRPWNEQTALNTHISINVSSAYPKSWINSISGSISSSSWMSVRENFVSMLQLKTNWKRSTTSDLLLCSCCTKARTVFSLFITGLGFYFSELRTNSNTQGWPTLFSDLTCLSITSLNSGSMVLEARPCFLMTWSSSYLSFLTLRSYPGQPKSRNARAIYARQRKRLTKPFPVPKFSTSASIRSISSKNYFSCATTSTAR